MNEHFGNQRTASRRHHGRAAAGCPAAPPPGARPCPARSCGRSTRCSRRLAVGYVVVESLGVEWPWLDGWGVDGFEIVAGALCILKAATVRRGRAVPVLLGVGLLCWAAGDIVLTVQSLGGATPPSALARRRLLRDLLSGHVLRADAPAAQSRQALQPGQLAGRRRSPGSERPPCAPRSPSTTCCTTPAAAPSGSR